MKTLALKKIRHNKGFEYISKTSHPGLSSHKTPSSAIVLENGVPLAGPANSLHVNIRDIGQGRYSLWFGTVRFSTSDNSDPCTNGRLYSLQYEENEERRFGHLNRILYLPTKLLQLPIVPVSLKNLLKEARYGKETLRHLGFSFPFWSFYYWLSFLYVAVRPDDD